MQTSVGAWWHEPPSQSSADSLSHGDKSVSQTAKAPATSHRLSHHLNSQHQLTPPPTSITPHPLTSGAETQLRAEETKRTRESREEEG
jgi:hypothetical protein